MPLIFVINIHIMKPISHIKQNIIKHLDICTRFFKNKHTFLEICVTTECQFAIKIYICNCIYKKRIITQIQGLQNFINNISSSAGKNNANIYKYI